VWVIGKLFSMVAKLQSSGTIDINRAVGAQGKVYLRIPENGTGRVLVTVNNSLREYDAQSNDSKQIASDTPIRVVWVDGNVLVVEKI
jgi:membrane protein implicated in regulation of membrane protease activity